MKNEGDRLNVKTSLGTEITYIIQDNMIVDIFINSDLSFNSNREKGDLLNFYMDCLGKPAKQFADLVCDGCGAAEIAFDVGCAAWIVCRGSVLVACAAATAAEFERRKREEISIPAPRTLDIPDLPGALVPRI